MPAKRQWSCRKPYLMASVANPIRIVIVAALDNRLEAPDLPLAPWA
jgi:hypothetical protein